MEPYIVLEQLKAIHRDIELDCGKTPDLVTDDAQPLDDLDGFDSLLIPTVVRLLAKAMGIIVPKGKRLRNPYITADGTRKLRLREVAKRFCDICSMEALAA